MMTGLITHMKKTLLELRADHKKVSEQMTKLHKVTEKEDRDYNEEEQTKFLKLDKKAEKLSKRIKVKEAEERLKFAYDQNPKKLEFVLELARFYIKVNLKHRANRYYEQVLVLKPNHDEAMRMLGRKKKTTKKKPRSFKDYLKVDFKDLFKSNDD